MYDIGKLKCLLLILLPLVVTISAARILHSSQRARPRCWQGLPAADGRFHTDRSSARLISEASITTARQSRQDPSNAVAIQLLPVTERGVPGINPPGT